jgi:para-aminobenzoate synthetase
MRTLHRSIDAKPDTEALFAAQFGEEPHAFWLDSASRATGARFSFLGAPGPLGFTVSYDVGRGEVLVDRDGEVEIRRESIFDFLEDQLERLRPAEAPDLPFGFDCGFVGHLGYELKAECGGDAAHEAATPDAFLIFADRLVAIDHVEGTVHLLALADATNEAEAERWLAATAAALGLLATLGGYSPPKSPTNGRAGVELRLARSRERYLEDIAACRRYLRAGDSYEICLTNKVSVETEAEPVALYRALRRANPAPYGALLRLGETSVLSSSPERFLRIDPDGGVEARPIKGTSRRGDTPAEDARLARALGADAKSRAENVTIVDLLRNDLGRVCELGSVEATRLMEVESYETVHQLVSTVRGRLRPEVGAPACVRACFPPGSMTGAPKRRTMAIVDELEGAARGVYSGAIGWFGLGGGCELSVAIRSIVLGPDGQASVGAGGAIVLDSDPAREYEEMLLKAVAPLRALDPGLPADYRRISFSDSTSRVTPRKSIVSGAAATTAG